MSIRYMAFVVALLLLIGCSCSVEKPSYVDTAPEDIAPQETTTPVETQPYIKQTFDPEAVYDHVFLNHSRILTSDEPETVKPNTAAGEAIISFQYNTDGSWDYTMERQDFYLVSGVTTALHGFNQKYFAVLNTYANVQAYCDIMDDYHEAYLDVMLEHLTFAPCEGIPKTEDGAYDIGYVAAREGAHRYEIRADGHLYYEQEGAFYKSEQTVDVAYLAAMLITSYSVYESRKSYSDFFNIFNENLPDGGEMQSFESKGELLVVNDTAYEPVGDSQVYLTDERLSTVGLMGIYANRTKVYPHASENHNLNPAVY